MGPMWRHLVSCHLSDQPGRLPWVCMSVFEKACQIISLIVAYRVALLTDLLHNYTSPWSPPGSAMLCTERYSLRRIVLELPSSLSCLTPLRIKEAEEILSRQYAERGSDNVRILDWGWLAVGCRIRSRLSLLPPSIRDLSLQASCWTLFHQRGKWIPTRHQHFLPVDITPLFWDQDLVPTSKTVEDTADAK